MPELPLDSGARCRARDLGILIGRIPPGRWNAITDVPGVLVGHTTLSKGDGPLVIGQGPVRTGVTVIRPHDGALGPDPVFAGAHVLNGNGEMTGLAWIEESGLLSSPIAITNTHSVGIVRDTLAAHEWGANASIRWSLPVVTETYDGFLSDIAGQHVRPEHVLAALESATGGPVAEGCVGGGTGMICHGFKGGIGTSSRVLPPNEGGWSIGVLVQANYGQRRLLRVNGVPVGQEIGPDEVPLPGEQLPPETGSIIVVIATDAPLLPTGCRRLAQRAGLGIARVGGVGADSSGDLFLAFSTTNRGLAARCDPGKALTVRTLPHEAMTPLFEAVVEVTEEAVINALCMATTMTGINGRIAYAIPLDLLRAVMRQYRRLSSARD